MKTQLNPEKNTEKTVKPSQPRPRRWKLVRACLSRNSPWNGDNVRTPEGKKKRKDDKNRLVVFFFAVQ